jgi:hypothetical protein
MEKAGDLLKLFLDGKQFAEGQKWSEFFVFWKRMLGERLATHSRIRDVKNGALIVETDHPGWIQMLQLRQNALLKEISRRYPDLGITSIHIRLSERKFWNEDERVERQPERERDRPEPDREPADRAEAQPEAEPSGTGGLSGIKDDSFRQLLARLETSIRNREREKRDR